jgi:hypothetical protein
MTSLKDFVRQQADGYWDESGEQLLAKIVDGYIKELEEHMKADQDYFDSLEERGYRHAVERMLKFLKGEE